MRGYRAACQRKEKTRMANMNYCRMVNTFNDLRDAHDHMDDDDLSVEESKYKDKLIALCKRIANEFGEDEDDE
jgi:hypothetical protein